MAIKFIAENHINTELTRLIEDADDYLILISPYIKLHDRFKRNLLEKLEKPNLQIVVVFGKNEEGIQKSLSKEDFEFLAQFPNIIIKYEPKLHAKYYASEDRAIITSMNLHEFSQNNNIEAGILMDVKGFVGNFINNDPEYDSYQYFDKVIKNSISKYTKEPVFKKGLMGLTNEYIESKVVLNEMDELYASVKSKPMVYKTFENKVTTNNGYCIRTGAAIPFNIKMPYSETAYKSWQRFANENYKEKFCHFSGEKCDGETTFKSPIIKKNWREVKGKFGF